MKRMIFRFFKYRLYGKAFFQSRVVCIGAIVIMLVFLSAPQISYASNVAIKSKSSSNLPSDVISSVKSNTRLKNKAESKRKEKSTVEEVKEESIFKMGSNIVYRFIDNNGYLFAPISGAAAGMIRCGFWCASVGGIASVIDELTVYFGYTDKRYLTWGMFGMTTGHVISPSFVSDIVGVVVGVLLPTGILNDHKELIAPAVSVVAGNSMGGTSGIITTGVAGVFEKVLLDNGIIDKHYLTFGVVGAAAMNLFGINPAIANSIGAVLGLIAASYEKEISANLLAPIKTAKSLYTTYNKFIPKEELDDHIEKHALILMGTQFLTQFLSLKIMGYQQNLVYNFERLDNPTGSAWNNFGKEMTNFAIFLFPYAIGQVFSSNVDHYFDKRLHVTLEEKIRSDLFAGETALRLSHDQSSTVLVDNLKEDVSTIVNSGSGLVTSAVSTAIGGAYGVGMIIVHSPNIFVYSTLYNKAESFVAELLANQRRSYGEEIRKLDSQLITTLKHDAENIRTITERDGIEITKEKVQQISSDLRDLEGSQRLWSMVNSLWWSIAGTVNYVFNYFLVGREVNSGRIPFENRNKIQIASWQTSSLLSWSGHQAQTISEIDQSLDRIIILEGKLHFLPDGMNNVDQINREAIEGNQLILKDLEIGFGDRVLVTIDDLKLDMGKAYAITGETGCGKTSLLSKIKGIKENGVFGKGYIYYPKISRDIKGGENRKIKGKAPKIVMLSQQDYFPLDSSLYEIISYPDKAPNDPKLNYKKREKISLLLEEIGLYAFSAKDTDIDTGTSIDIDNNGCIEAKEVTGVCRKDKWTESERKEEKEEEEEEEKYDESLNLDSKKDWYTYLSGGEKKKIMVVSAIIKNPDILILDEIFNGLDPASIITVQQILKKHLSNTMILSVDHHAQDNNHDAFYDDELHFDNNGIILREIDNKY